MKKALSLILALVMCLSLCACGGGALNGETQGTYDDEGSQTNDKTTQGSDNPNTNNSNNQANIDLICGIRWEQLSCAYDGEFGTRFSPDGSFWPDAGGDQLGTWTIDGDIISMTKLSTSQTLDYQLKSCGDVYFLVGQQETLASVSEKKIPSQVPTKQVDITLDNWQEYFEFITFSQVSKRIDLFGTHTEETATFGILKLKDEYARYVVRVVSTMGATFEIGKLKNDCIMNESHINSIIDYPEPGGTYGKYAGDMLYYYGTLVELDETYMNDVSFEMKEIEGTLYFIDIE